MLPYFNNTRVYDHCNNLVEYALRQHTGPSPWRGRRDAFVQTDVKELLGATSPCVSNKVFHHIEQPVQVAGMADENWSSTGRVQTTGFCEDFSMLKVGHDCYCLRDGQAHRPDAADDGGGGGQAPARGDGEAGHGARGREPAPDAQGEDALRHVRRIRSCLAEVSFRLQVINCILWISLDNRLDFGYTLDIMHCHFG